MKKDRSAHFKQSTQLPWVELRVADNSSACYEAHSHDEFSFGIIDQGEALYLNRGRRHTIGKGDIVTINPADVHACNPHQGLWSYRMLFVDTGKMGECQQEVLDDVSFDYQPFRYDLERNPHLKQDFLNLFSALHSESDRLTAESQLFRFIARSFQLKDVSRTQAQLDLPGLQRVRDKLLDELDSAHQLSELAEEANMSRYQLLRAFQHHFGLSPHAYLMDEKIKRSKVLLKRGQDIAGVALSLGFSDQAHFQRQFKRKVAVTPKYYQSHFV